MMVTETAKKGVTVNGQVEKAAELHFQSVHCGCLFFPLASIRWWRGGGPPVGGGCSLTERQAEYANYWHTAAVELGRRESCGQVSECESE
jgi:hypothetical protein